MKILFGYGATPYGAFLSGGSAPAPTPSPSPSPTPTSAPSGGWAPPTPRVRTKREIEDERIALGILEARAEPVIEKVAAKVFKRAQDVAATGPGLTPPMAQFDPLDWLMANSQAQRKILEADLMRKRVEWSVLYWAALKLEIEKKWAQWLQDREDEQIIALLMSM